MQVLEGTQYVCKCTPFEQKWHTYLCNFIKSEKSVPSVRFYALITIVLTKQFLRSLQWHSKVHAIESPSSVLFRRTQKFLASLQQQEWKEHETYQTLGQKSRMRMYWTLGYKLSRTQWIGFQCHGYEWIRHTCDCIVHAPTTLYQLRMCW